MRNLEIIAMTVEDARRARTGGASSLELVRDMALGGLTPSLDIVTAIRDAVPLPLRVILRPHAGQFTYSEAEIGIVLSEIERLKAIGVEGVVFGALFPEGTVDLATSERIARAAAPLEFTFHRAIDVSRDSSSALPKIAAFSQRLLTSGLADNVWDGRETIHNWVQAYGSQMTVAAGGGLRVANLAEVIRLTDAPEYHFGSAARTDGVVDISKVEDIVSILMEAEESAGV
jgi:copper homeostasis protein